MSVIMLHPAVSLDCRDGEHSGCRLCECTCHTPALALVAAA